MQWTPSVVFSFSKATFTKVALLVQVFDYNLFATAAAVFGHLMPDFKRHAKREKSS